MVGSDRVRRSRYGETTGTSVRLDRDGSMDRDRDRDRKDERNSPVEKKGNLHSTNSSK